MKVQVNSETGKLRKVILGIASDRGKEYFNNPKQRDLAAKGDIPTEQALIQEVEAFRRILEENEVKVFRPDNIPEQDQIFTRDIGFAIGNDFFLANMRKDNRKPEIKGIEFLTKRFSNVHRVPKGAFIEGGDVIVWKKYVFVGISDRTNMQGLEFLKEKLGKKRTLISFPLRITDEGRSNILHLDCTFQPVGHKYAVIYKEGFLENVEAIYDIFGEKNLIQINQEEMYNMMANFFSINPEKVVMEQSLKRLSEELAKINIKAIGTRYGQVSKLGGLLRCSTCPIEREGI